MSIQNNRLLVLASALALSPAGHAATFCATSTAELQNALDTAAVNGENDVVRVAVGTYPAPVGGPFDFDQLAPVNGDGLSLTLSGGWTAFFGNPCGYRSEAYNSFDTILDGEDRERVLRIIPDGAPDIVIEGITFFRGNPSEGGTRRGGGLEIRSANFTGKLRVERSAFLFNTADYGSALEAGGSLIRLRNNLFVGNDAVNSGVIEAVIGNGDSGIYLTANTIINNATQSSATSAQGGVYIFLWTDTNALLVNNVIKGNDVTDLKLSGEGNVTLRNNLIDARVGSITTETGQITGDPMFVGGLLNFTDFTPDVGSPLIDTGIKPPTLIPFPPPFDSNWGLPDYDLLGRPRTQGVTVDVGAYEALPVDVFSDGFE